MCTSTSSADNSIVPKLIEIKQLEFAFVAEPMQLLGVAKCSIVGAKPRACWWINLLNIKEEFRGQGYGSLLLETVCEELRSRGPLPIYVQPAAGSFLDIESLVGDAAIAKALEQGYRKTIAWYKRHGFVEEDLILVRYPTIDIPLP